MFDAMNKTCFTRGGFPNINMYQAQYKQHVRIAKSFVPTTDYMYIHLVGRSQKNVD